MHARTRLITHTMAAASSATAPAGIGLAAAVAERTKATAAHQPHISAAGHATGGASLQLEPAAITSAVRHVSCEGSILDQSVQTSSLTQKRPCHDQLKVPVRTIYGRELSHLASFIVVGAIYLHVCYLSRCELSLTRTNKRWSTQHFLLLRTRLG